MACVFNYQSNHFWNWNIISLPDKPPLNCLSIEPFLELKLRTIIIKGIKQQTINRTIFGIETKVKTSNSRKQASLSIEPFLELKQKKCLWCYGMFCAINRTIFGIETLQGWLFYLCCQHLSIEPFLELKPISFVGVMKSSQLYQSNHFWNWNSFFCFHMP